MTFYAITKVSNYLQRPQIRSFHANMFHGLAERDGKEMPHDRTIWANTESPSPLMISRTIHGVPEICQPSTHFVVSERLAEKFKRFRNIRIAQVVFKRLVDVEYKKGDMSWADRWGNGDPCDLLRTLPEVPEFHSRIGRYFEIQTYRWKDVVDRYPSATKVAIEVGTPPTVRKADEISIAKEMLDDYPIFWWGSIILNEEAFAALDNWLDRDFFIVRECELD